MAMPRETDMERNVGFSLNPATWYPAGGRCEPVVTHLCVHRALS